VLPAWIMLAVALFCTVLVWSLAGNHDKEAAHQRFNMKTDQVASAIHARMLTYEGLLSGGVGLFEASEQVDRHEWQRFVHSLELEKRFPGILGIGFTQRISLADLEAHQRDIRAGGLPDYHVMPAGKRDEYHAIVYLEPFAERNHRVFGYDMFSDPIRKAAMIKARDTGMPVLSRKVTLLHDSARNRQAGALLYLPVYHKGMPVATLAQRREALKGFVYSPFRVNDLIHRSLGSQFPELDLEIYDGDEPNSESRLYGMSPDLVDGEKARVPQFILTRPFPLNQHSWTLRVKSRPEFEAQTDTLHKGWILAGGLVISLLLFGITWSLVTTRVRAKSLARTMTHVLRESEERFRAVHDFAAIGIVQSTPEGHVIHTNPAFQHFLGYSASELAGCHWSQFTVFEDQTESQRLRRDLIRGERDHYEIEKRYLRKDGQVTWGRVSVTGARREDGSLEFVLALIEDISARKRQEAVIAHQAFHDALTGLPNRLLFTDRLDHAIKKAKRNKTSLALMFLDLDHFKEVNDTLGHAAGDACLQDVGERLRGCVRESDTVARIGGDEFTVLLPNINGVSGALQVAQEILQKLPITYEVAGGTLTITPSIGIVLYPDHASDAETLIKMADSAMYASKEAGRNRYTLHARQQTEKLNVISG